MSTLDPPQTPSTSMTVIESQKENIQPLHSGRSASVLSNVLSAPKSDLAAQRAVHEAAVADTSAAEDPLQAWVNYIHWLRDSYTTGDNAKSMLVPVLERATRTFRADERIRRDVRYIRIWIYYAQLVHEYELVYEYLMSNSIGLQWAVTYYEYAFQLESDFKCASILHGFKSLCSIR